MPKISVIMPVYNGAKYLKEAIQSVLSQTMKDFELLIVDDGSTDDTEGVVSKLTDPRVKYFKQEHAGMVHSLHFGVERATGEYLARLDCDDVMESNRLEEQYGLMQADRELALCGSWATVISSDGSVVGEMSYVPTSERQIRRYALLHNPFIHSTVMIRKEVLDKVGNYSLFFRYGEDYDLWVRILYRFKSVNINKKLIKYRLHQNQVTKRFNLPMRLYSTLVRLRAGYLFVLGRFLK